MSDAPVLLELTPPFGEVVFNRPNKRNALSLQIWRALPDLFAKLQSDPSVSVIILHGGDTGTFAAGADISEFEASYATPDAARATSATIAAGVNAVATCGKPVLAAIEGPCIGGGVSLAIAADLRVASASATFGITPAKLGLLYSPTDTKRLIETVGLANAKELLFTGRIVSSEEALGIGLINRVCDSATAVEDARALGRQIAASSQWSVRRTKDVMRLLSSNSCEDFTDAEDLFLNGFSGDDFEEGYRAFLEKRKPRFPFR